MNRASASPSIASLVDPPNQAMTSPSIATQSFFHHQHQQARYRDDPRTSVPPSPTVNRLAASAVPDSSPIPAAPYPQTHAPSKTHSPTTATSALATVSSQPKKAMANENGNSKKTNGSATTSAAASPKPFSKAKDKEIFPAPPPLPGAMGAGLNDGTEFRAPTVVLNIPLAGETNKYINFTRLAEDQYGWDALHPRLAAQRDRLARVAAAGAALERNGSNRESGDEMSLDSGDEGSNVEMGGMSDGRTGTDGGVKKVVRKRKMKEDEYDKDDGFVDDTELLWEEQAAAANDGFFVYSGPLVPEVPKPVELRYISYSPFHSSNQLTSLQSRWRTKAWPRTWKSRWRTWSCKWNSWWWRTWLSRRLDGTWFSRWIYHTQAQNHQGGSGTYGTGEA
jgi:hypothetical protein